ncbi:hemerythrin domain-containing protein [Ramlibacter sp. AW1]|uniref:Hemerythrin domain-containing protein n=1 Tax=Ramlibacter aurantiacus TaxID=2801330 RepID=A0A936ZFF4_9BURK|nr:hemerythrin domain-containing protein [Ramlibacter aurantiacus]MBL0419293.1 hemerythrin domain-containing protein [Ramlibacter aurantiacus]
MPQLAQKDACELLDADHLAVKHLFVEYARLAKAMPAESTADREALARKICDELTVHTQIEEDIFYPALRQAAPDAGDVIDEGIEEHHEAKVLISQIRELGTAGAEMDKLVAELARAVEHHVKEERDELFPKAKAAPGMDLMSLGEQLRDRQRELEAAASSTDA